MLREKKLKKILELKFEQQSLVTAMEESEMTKSTQLSLARFRFH